MKKIFALATVLALTACGNDADAPEEAVIADEPVVAAPAATGSAGTYAMSDGAAQTQIVLASDGTYTMSENGAQVETGNWTDAAEGPCLTAQGAEETCFTKTVADDGMVTMVDPTGTETTWTYSQ